MRIRFTLDVPDGARKYIGLVAPNGIPTKWKRFATRGQVIDYVRERIALISRAYPWWDDETFDAEDLADCAQAITYLRANGKTDMEIRAWLLLHRARLHVLRKTIPGMQK